ncbi:MAG: hypothetical protein OEX00_08695 [Gammaproteobacteria bacterium]|nr:hypothetical protein [Gammaproteobacteria bacterium]
MSAKIDMDAEHTSDRLVGPIKGNRDTYFHTLPIRSIMVFLKY